MKASTVVIYVFGAYAVLALGSLAILAMAPSWEEQAEACKARGGTTIVQGMRQVCVATPPQVSTPPG